jgi:hypothetical protein
MFSQLACGTGLIVVRMDSAYYVAKVIAAKHPLIHWWIEAQRHWIMVSPR